MTGRRETVTPASLRGRLRVDSGPHGEGAPEPARREDAAEPEDAAASAGPLVRRCPYCRDGVDADGSAVCRDCLTPHHPACWVEAGACSSCGSRRRFEAEPLTLGRAVTLLEQHGYGAEQVRALLAPPAAAERRGNVLVHRVIVPLLLFALIAALIAIPTSIVVAQNVRYDSPLAESKVLLHLAGMAVGMFSGFLAALVALRRS